ncbi:MAG: 30S ribosomal protein S8e [Thermoplasmata archaeon HGW-Thermoplasmata-1]|nr:MAG: 30S ribosomal protein S8e [Thermoplasmata archaeon HGW-Thermoplasmata-1]
MALWQAKSRRKVTGGRRIFARGKRKFEIGREVQPTHMGEPKLKNVRTTGGNKKTRVMSANMANVTDPATGKTVPAAIKNVVENPANPHYVRRNLLTKGAVLETELGKARITSRPGQDGTINAVLIKE